MKTQASFHSGHSLPFLPPIFYQDLWKSGSNSDQREKDSRQGQDRDLNLSNQTVHLKNGMTE